MVMKKILFAIAAATAITGCSQSEEFENVEQRAEIGFNSIVKNATRAAEVNLDGLKLQGFNVYAYNTGNDVIGTGVLDKSIMENEEVKWNTNQWESAKYYWPSTGNVQFFAYSSSKKLALTVGSTDKYPTLVGYEVASAAEQQEDLLVTMATDKTKADATVNFTFSHALTQINFSIKSKAEDGLTYTVSSIEIDGVNNKGTYQYEKNSWINLDGSIKYTYPLIADATVVGGATAKAIGTTSLMLLPQASSTRKILVSYSVIDKNGDEVYATATPKEVDLSSTSWGVGKKIRYTLSLTNDATPIGWTVSDVDAWTNDNDQNNDKEPVTPSAEQ